MSTYFYDQDVDMLAKDLRELLEKKNAYLVLTDGMHGQAKAGTKQNPRLRMPMSYATDILKHPESIPIQAQFFGIMILPKELAVPPADDEQAEQEATDAND